MALPTRVSVSTKNTIYQAGNNGLASWTYKSLTDRLGLLKGRFPTIVLGVDGRNVDVVRTERQ
jgi:hypothetical protein